MDNSSHQSTSYGRQVSQATDADAEPITETKAMKKTKFKPKPGASAALNQNLELRRLMQQQSDRPLWKLPKDFKQHEIASGKFSRVYKLDKPINEGDHEKAEKVVAKVLQADAKSDRARNLFVKEMKIGARVEHPNLVRFLAYWDCPLTVYMEYVQFDWSSCCSDDSEVDHISHDLVDFLHTMHTLGLVEDFHLDKNANIFHSIIWDIATGLNYLHRMNVVHRDLKPLNVLVSNKGGDFLKGEDRVVLCKITDFGESRSYFATTVGISKTANNNLERGTTPFMSPELLEGKYDIKSTDVLKQIDIWAFGMIIFCVLNPDIEHPFHQESQEVLDLEAFKDIMKSAFMQGKVPPAGSKIYQHLADEMPRIKRLMEQCLRNDPCARPTMKDIISGLTKIDEVDTISVSSREAAADANGYTSLGIHLRDGAGNTDNSKVDNALLKEIASGISQLNNKTDLIQSNTGSLLQLAKSTSQTALPGTATDHTSETIAQQVSDLSLSDANEDDVTSNAKVTFQVNSSEPQAPHRLELQKHSEILMEHLDPEPIVTTLYSRSHFNHTEKEVIQSQKNRPQQVQALLNTIYAKDASVYSAFLRVLPESNQTYLADRITGKAGSDFVNPPHVALLTAHHERLLSDMCEPGSIADSLYSKLLITSQQMEVIKSKQTNRDKNEVVLEIVRRFSPENFTKFIDTLYSTQNTYLADLLKDSLNPTQ